MTKKEKAKQQKPPQSMLNKGIYGIINIQAAVYNITLSS